MEQTGRLAACRPLLWHGPLSLAFNTGIAIMLTVVGFGGGIVVNFVYSQCIGLTVWLLVDGGRHLLWPNGKPPMVPMWLLVIASMLVGSVGGTTLASMLLGHPRGPDTYLTSLLITAAAGFIGSLYFWEREKVAGLEANAAQEKSRTAVLERQAAEARLKLLQAQIEPHFLFNTLANLRALIPLDPARAQHMLDHLDGFLRAALAAARKEQNTLGDEFALLGDYLEILKIRMDKRLSYRLELPDALAAVLLPPMLLQPLVENAVKHGLEPSVAGGEVAVSAQKSGGMITILVSDTGIGPAGGSDPGTGLGLAHVRERLAAAYGSRASLEVRDANGAGMTVAIAIPEQTA